MAKVNSAGNQWHETFFQLRSWEDGALHNIYLDRKRKARAIIIQPNAVTVAKAALRKLLREIQI